MTEDETFTPPFFVVRMDVDADGRGPVLDPDLAVATQYEVWNGLWLSIAGYTNHEDALEYVNWLNEKYGNRT